MKYALIENNTVAQISMAPKSGWVEVSDDVFSGFLVSGDTYTDPGQEPTEPTTLEQMAAIWDAVPAYIRGPYFYLVESIRRLVSANDIEAAQALLDSVTPTEEISSDPAKLEDFNSGISQMKAILA